jgi:hypothetical protein
VLAALEEYAATGTGDIRHVVSVKPQQFRLRVGEWRIRFRRRPGAAARDPPRPAPLEGLRPLRAGFTRSYGRWLDVSARYVSPPDPGVLFLTKRGHAQLSTTALYTRVSIRQLQDVQRRTHPARTRRTDEDRERLRSSLAAATALRARGPSDAHPPTSSVLARGERLPPVDRTEVRTG